MQQLTFSENLFGTQKSKVLTLLISVLAFSFSTETLAQGGLLEEVIVTAQKREESIQDVGIAITAFTGAQLDAFGFTNSTELSAFTPGVHISGNNGGGTQQFTIRGATQNDFFDLAEAPNAVYVDEAYQAAGQAHLFASFDMDRVEILKGPQGTLFGRNATGGLVHYVTRKPTKETEGYADVTYGNYDQVRVEAAVSGAISDSLSVRLSGFHRSHEPILKNVFTDADLPATPFFIANPGVVGIAGAPRGPLNGSLEGNQADLWDDDQYAVRGQMLFEASDDLEMSLTTQYAKSTPGSGPYQNVATIAEKNAAGDVVNTLFSNATTNPNSCESLNVGTNTCWDGTLNGTPFPGEPLDLDFDLTRPAPNSDFFGYVDPDGTEGLTTSTDHARSNFDRYELMGITGKIKWDLDFGKLTSVTNWSDQDKRTSLDVDSGPAPQFVVIGDSEISWITQELRLEGETDRLRWLAGVYYLHIDGEFSQALADTIGGINVFGASPPPNGAGVSDLFLDGAVDAFLKTDSYSIFGQVDYDLTDQLELNLGWRGIQEEKDYRYSSKLTINTSDSITDGIRNGGTIVADFFPDHVEKTDKFLWSAKAGLNYSHSDDLLLYGSFNRGVKAGSCNAPLLTFLTPDQYCYDEEILLAYEAGFKATLLDGKARLNFSAYYYDYQDYQVFQFVGTSGAVFNLDAENYGFEAELFANPMENLDLMLGIGIIDTKVKDVNVAPGVPRNVDPSFTPDVQFSGLGRYTWPNSLMGGSVSLQVDGNYASSSFSNINNFGTDKLDSYWLGNASLKWISADDRWEVSGFIDNFSDTRNQNIGFQLAAICGCDEQSFGLPRMYGARLRYNYF
ncbi:MAG: TonB-dependent receptor plug domain-containing protein [Gammaproteobacteria bacterium]|nr:TonB-dependent receptor plug domain-containing protein [Gammaproteobacteria bacterium]